MEINNKFKNTKKLFNIPTSINDKPYIYFNGNSLGLQPKTIYNANNNVLDLWKMENVNTNNIGYNSIQKKRDSDERNIIKISTNLLGCFESELAIMNSLSTNLHMLLCSFYRPTKTKYKIITEYGAFNSDQYIVQTQLLHHNINLNDGLLIVGDKNKNIISTDDIIDIINKNSDSISILFMGAINYITGQFLDIKSITEYAHKFNIIVIYDLAHAIGNVPLELHDWNVDCAAWCSYKYLNAGPGSIGGIFVHQKHFPTNSNSNINILGGWWGQKLESRISFLSESKFDPIPNASGWQTSNPSSILLSMLSDSMNIFDIAGGIYSIRQKSQLLTDFLEKRLIDEFNDNINIITPPYPFRGAQLSLSFNNININPEIIYNKLLANFVVCDLRDNNIFRITPVPLYNTLDEIDTFINILKNILYDKI